MSRIGKEPVAITEGVKITLGDENEITVKGPKGELTRKFHPDMKFAMEDDKILVTRPDDAKHNKALHGLSRSLLFNMVLGVSQGYSKNLEIVGIGYKSELKGKNLLMTLGYSHPILFVPPQGVQVTINNKQGTDLTISGVDKEVVGDSAAKIRSFKKPEPYKGKGIRYKGEYVPRKAGKYAG